MSSPRIQEASIDWSDSANPLSETFDDVYFSRHSGKAETEHVFVNGNRLIERFQALEPGSCFTIAETGFGSGLNFLVTWHIWQSYAPQNTSLHFVSVERFPLSPVDLRTSHRNWPEFQSLSEKLQKQYPAPVEGMHRCVFQDDRVFLTLYYGDANHWLEQCSFKADAWFLDGFSPQQNPDMWSDQLFQQVASHSAESTTFATYTAAGFIRRGLQAQGFNVSKATGFAEKRHMTVGLMGKASTKTVNRGLPKDSTVLVVGSGLAGALTASTLANRGFRVQVFEQGSQIASGASGNAQGALYIKLAVDWNPHTRIHLSHYLYAQRAYEHLLNLPAGIWCPTGVIQLAFDDKEACRQQKFLRQNEYPESIVRLVSSDEASLIAGVTLDQSGLFFPDAGWLAPATLCRRLLQHPNILVHLNTAITDVNQNTEGAIELIDEKDQVYKGETAILAQGHEPPRVNIPSELPIKPISGQISLIDMADDSESADPSYPLKSVLCGNGYALPSHNEKIVFGATFKPNTTNTETSSTENQENLEKLAGLSAQLGKFATARQNRIQARKSIRCTLPDYLPVIAPIKQYPLDNSQTAERISGSDTKQRQRLFINTGYGSKGLTIAPLAAEIIADMIEGVPMPLEDELLHRLSGERFNTRKAEQKRD